MMRAVALLATLSLVPRHLAAAPPPPPTAEEVRAEMAFPSTDHQRGQQDGKGYAATAAAMAEVWEKAAAGPAPERLGPSPDGPVLGVLCPHDDYVYAARVYRQVLPLVSRAKTVVLVGVFHKARRFGAKEVLVFEDYATWRTPDGPLAVSPLREALRASLPEGGGVVADAMHDSEHSLEAIAFCLKHQNPDVQIVPILVSPMSPERMRTLSAALARPLAAAAEGGGVAVVISSDAVHYGPDFDYTPFGEGGVTAYTRAVTWDETFLKETVCAAPTPDAGAIWSALNREGDPPPGRVTWCGRFSIPFGILLLQALSREAGWKAPEAFPLAYSTSVGWPTLPLSPGGPTATAPSTLYHFVGYPAVAFQRGAARGR